MRVGYTVVYGPVERVEQPSFWEDFADIGSGLERPWHLSGDFNATRLHNDKNRGRGFKREMVGLMI